MCHTNSYSYESVLNGRNPRPAGNKKRVEQLDRRNQKFMSKLFADPEYYPNAQIVPSMKPHAKKKK